MATESEWFINTISMSFNLVFSFTLVIMFQRAMSYFQRKHNQSAPKRTVLLLNGVFISGSICAILCITLHISDNFNPDICKYGTTLCIVLYFIAKTFLYIFLIERAKCSQGLNPTFPSYVFDKILPIYIMCYLLFFAITVFIYFRGLIWTDSIHLVLYTKGITGCFINEGVPNIMYTAIGLDIFNTIVLLFLFIYPLYVTLYQIRVTMDKATIKDDPSYQQDEKEIITAIKINTICTSISCITGVVSLFLTTRAGSIQLYVWLIGNWDMAINSLCTFCMIAANRAYVSDVIFCGCAGLKCNKCL